ncbi:hypothetical protein NFI96_018576 [Prochilodus magdalenae]|nr:hypothetical protein NFI96_018576 [Prochilodus magdalenae]
MWFYYRTLIKVEHVLQRFLQNFKGWSLLNTSQGRGVFRLYSCFHKQSFSFGFLLCRFL